tara:strand:- start:438 stop:647 length:210 start_codon:yes stop_codon:yes gene_type:complete
MVSTGTNEPQVQQRLSMSRNKRLTKPIDEAINLEDLNIDWHLAEYDYPAMEVSTVAKPVVDVQSTYAAA